MLKCLHVNYNKAKKYIISGTYLKPIYKSIDHLFWGVRGDSQSPWFLKYYLEWPLAMRDSLWLISLLRISNNKMYKRYEIMFSGIAYQTKKVIDGSSFIILAFCLETLLDHVTRRMVPSKACEYCWIKGKDSRVKKDETAKNCRADNRTWDSWAYKKLQKSAYG